MKTKRQTLETVIVEALNEYPQDTRFDLIAFELWGNRKEGFETNDAWKIGRDCVAEDIPAIARARWEAFKVNYLPQAKVRDLEVTGEIPFAIMFEVDCVPFLEIRPLASRFEVTCGNIGTVYSGDCESQARNAFDEYKRMSSGEYGRASGEEVTLWQDGEPILTHESTLED